MNRQDYLDRYKDKSVKTQEYLGFCIDTLLNKYGYISTDYLISLDLLAENLEVMFTAMKEMRESGKVTEVDRYRGVKKSAAMQTFFNAQTYVHKLLGSFGFTPSARSKIHENTVNQDLRKTLEAIRNTDDEEEYELVR